ncbi:unnamed protein product [Cylindrotheca closterium]|uniref:Uncharacterized protein n=1 Tax=Cylindrotheca closterium TaxID=2856 RepID=A0AAD2FF45_9STRA|nr:unnamed protein product [Cylindrotheca closterium]
MSSKNSTTGKTDAPSVTADGKPVKSSRIKKMMKGLTRKKKKSSSSVSDAMSTAVSVQADEISTMSVPVSGAKRKPVTLQLVLLLMDPSTRRFELLQLEFDSDKARVSDIIAQIPISVTEPSIRSQQYEGVVDASGTSMSEFVRLIDFCRGRTVLVALPKGLTVKECVRLARPILSDSQVEKMLSAGEFDISGWKKKDSKGRSRAISEQKVKPSAPTQVKTEKSREKSIFPTIIMLALIAILLQAANSFLSSPIQVGKPLKPGTWKSKCGLLGLVPPSPLDKYGIIPECTNSFLEVHGDGSVSIRDAAKELDVLMRGGVCGEEDEDCVDGLVLEEDGKVLIGGTQVKSGFIYGESTGLNPWPFEKEPKLKLKPSSRS